MVLSLDYNLEVVLNHDEGGGFRYNWAINLNTASHPKTGIVTQARCEGVRTGRTVTGNYFHMRCRWCRRSTTVTELSACDIVVSGWWPHYCFIAGRWTEAVDCFPSTYITLIWCTVQVCWNKFPHFLLMYLYQILSLTVAFYDCHNCYCIPISYPIRLLHTISTQLVRICNDPKYQPCFS